MLLLMDHSKQTSGADEATLFRTMLLQWLSLQCALCHLYHHVILVINHHAAATITASTMILGQYVTAQPPPPAKPQRRQQGCCYTHAASLRSGNNSSVASKRSPNCSLAAPLSFSPIKWCTTSSAVAGPKHNPDPSCPAATNTPGNPGTGPMAGKPPTAYGRSPTRVDCDTSLLLTAARPGRKAVAFCIMAVMMSLLGTCSHPLNSLELPAT